MNAAEALKLSLKSLSTTVIEPYKKRIDERIREAAERGKRSIHNPQFETRSAFNDGYYTNADEQKELKKYYESQGFTWTDYPNPDPGHPCSAPYTTLSW